MTMSTTVIQDRRALQVAFCELANEAEEISLISLKVASAPGESSGVWEALRTNLHKVREVVAPVEGSDPELLEVLHRASVLRRTNPGAGGPRATVALFRRAGWSAGLVSTAPFPFHGFGSAVDIAIRIAGEPLEPNLAELEQLFREARRHAWVPYLHEIRSAASAEAHASAHENESATAIWSRVSTHTLGRLQFVREAGRVQDLRAQMVAEFIANATTVEARLGFSGASIDASVYWHPTFRVWANFAEVDNRYVHRFGTSTPESGGSLPVVVEINVPREGVNARIAGDFVEDAAAGRVFLAHRGRIGGGRGIGKASFWQRAQLASVLADRGDGVESRVVLVGELGSPRLVENIAAFVQEVARLKAVLAEPDADDDPLDSEQGEEDPPTDFLEITDREQRSEIVWGCLLGQGPLEKDEAVRHAANALREEGLADYGRLSSKGPLYQAVLEAIEGGVREELFDRPRRGYVRACMSSADQYTRESWEGCTENALPEGEVVPRADAVRMVAEWARENVGLEFERIRTNGKIDAGVRAAFRVLIRRGRMVAHGRDGVELIGEDE